MERWEVGFANQIKKREKKPIGPVIGVTVSVSPPVVQILDGAVVLEKEKLYVCRHLMERKSKGSLKMTATHNGSAAGSGTCPDGGVTVSGQFNLSGNFTANGDVELEEVWKPGDLVLCVPDSTQQRFFIVDVIKEG